ncbi:MAG: enzyme of heme biosynthesis [Rikenellaceae bacterium]|jgi:tetratricopeptide (TPR) repeat protein|nr:enzyme of heme biosynthesis [Rikenellaceae bacterium]
MKTFKLFLTVALLAFAFGASAQSYMEDPRYGATPAEREKNVLDLNFFNDAYNNKDYDTALGYLRSLLKGAPKASENLYIKGSNIYKSKILQAKSLAEKKAYIDSLMMIYDKRAEAYADHPERGVPYIMANKAREFLTFSPMDREQVREHFLHALEVAGDKPDPDFVNQYYQELVNDYKADLVEGELVMNEYDRLIVVFDEDSEAQKTFEALFIGSGVADCANLEKIFAPRIEANPTDALLLEKCVALLNRAHCENDFMVSVAEKFYAVKPTSETAQVIAKMFQDRKEYAKALKYLNEAIATETDPVMKANLCVSIAASQLGENNARVAADYARQAIDISPDNGYAYLILGQAQAVGASACSGFDRQCAYWVVYDTLAKARALLSSTGKAEDETLAKSVEQQMGSYRASFPSKEECFFRGLNNGDGYSVNCGWVSGRTTVRER